MKKILATIFAAALCVSAFAKNIDELCSEFSALGDFNTRLAYTKDNKADCVAAFNDWKNTNLAKFSLTDAPNAEAAAAMTDEQKKLVNTKRALFAKLFDHAYVELTAPDRTLCLLGSGALRKKMDVDNPTFFADLKTANFVLDGVALSLDCQFWVAITFGEIDFCAGIIKAQGAKTPSWILRDFAKWHLASYLLGMSDTKTAYGYAVMYESAILGKSDKATLGDALKTVQDLQDTLYLRITRANKL